MGITDDPGKWEIADFIFSYFSYAHVGNLRLALGQIRRSPNHSTTGVLVERRNERRSWSVKQPQPTQSNHEKNGVITESNSIQNITDNSGKWESAGLSTKA